MKLCAVSVLRGQFNFNLSKLGLAPQYCDKISKKTHVSNGLSSISPSNPKIEQYSNDGLSRDCPNGSIGSAAIHSMGPSSYSIHAG